MIFTPVAPCTLVVQVAGAAVTATFAMLAPTAAEPVAADRLYPIDATGAAADAVAAADAPAIDTLGTPACAEPDDVAEAPATEMLGAADTADADPAAAPAPTEMDAMSDAADAVAVAGAGV